MSLVAHSLAAYDQLADRLASCVPVASCVPMVSLPSWVARFLSVADDTRAAPWEAFVAARRPSAEQSSLLQDDKLPVRSA